MVRKRTQAALREANAQGRHGGRKPKFSSTQRTEILSMLADGRSAAKIADWSNAKMRDAPPAAIPKAWEPYVLDTEGLVADPRAYVFAIIDA